MLKVLKYEVYSAGRVLAGYEEAMVIETFAQAFNISTDKAAEYLVGRKLIQRGLIEAEANSYKEKISALGLEILLEEEKQVSAGPVPPVATESERSDESKTCAANGDQSTCDGPQMICPKCQVMQPRAEQCRDCGLVYRWTGVQYVSRSELSYQNR